MPTAADTEKMGNSEVTNNTLQYTNSVLNKKILQKKAWQHCQCIYNMTNLCSMQLGFMSSTSKPLSPFNKYIISLLYAYLQILTLTCTKNYPLAGMHNQLSLKQEHTTKSAVPNTPITCYIQSPCCHTISHFSYISKYFLPIKTTKSWVIIINQYTKPLGW